MPPRGTRPTTDRVRESLFNVLSARLDLAGISVLDLYAGSGALGLEALSRGAAAAVFVEADQRAAAVITGNIATVGLSGATVRRGSVAAFLAAASADPVDLVFADPPYEVAAAEIDDLLAALDSQGWVAPGSVVVIERAASSPVVNWPGGWTGWRERRYGGTRVDIASVDEPHQ